MTTAALVRTGEPTEPSVGLAAPRAQLQLLRPIVQPAEMIKVQEETRNLIEQALQEGRDYGVIPGTERTDREGNDISKKTLLKPGAERVANGFGCQYGEPIIVDKEIDHDREVRWKKRKKGGASYEGVSYGIYRYVLKVPVVELSSGRIVGWGAGACSTMESKYVDRPRDSENTVFKMAAKRARIDACLTTFGLSDQFTQDVEDLEQGRGDSGEDSGSDNEERAPRTFTLEQALELPFPFTTHAKYGGKPLKDVSTHMLTVARDYLRTKIDEHGETVDRVEPLIAVELVIQSRQVGEQRQDPTRAGASNESSTSAPGGSSASSPNGSSATTTTTTPAAGTAAAPATPASAPAIEGDGFLNDGLDRYGEPLSPASKGSVTPPPAKGAADSVYLLAKHLRQLIDHPKFPEKFRSTAKSDMSARVGKPNYERWLKDSVEAAEEYLRAQCEPQELKALGIAARE